MAAYPVSAVRLAQPDAFICWAVESRCSAVIDRAALTDRVARFPRDRWRADRWSAKTWHEQTRAYARLRAAKFDAGLDLQGHLKTALCLRLAKPRVRRAVAATDAVSRVLNPLVAIPDEIRHTVDRHMFALRTFGDFPTPVHPLMPQGPLPDGLEPGYISIMTGASSARKTVPLEVWSEVARALESEGHRVIAIGGPKDGVLEGVENWVGRTSLHETLAVVAASRLHLAPDTGTGHIAAAYGVPVVSVFGRTGHQPEKFRPYGPGTTVVQETETAGETSAAPILAAARAGLV